MNLDKTENGKRKKNPFQQIDFLPFIPVFQYFKNHLKIENYRQKFCTMNRLVTYFFVIM